jgi:hypothetical protein
LPSDERKDCEPKGAVRVVAVEKSGRFPALSAEEIAGELARCLARFLDATADETVMQRAKEYVSLWHSLSASKEREIDLTVVHP